MSVVFPKAFTSPDATAGDARRGGAFASEPVLVLDRAPGAERLVALREQVRRLERDDGNAPGATAVPTGVPEIDATLPGGGLATGALHEVLAGGPPGHDGAALAFAARLLGRFDAARAARGAAGPVLWCRRPTGVFDAPPYAPALAPFIDPARLIVVAARGADDVAWAMEEGLRCRGLCAVLGEIADADLVATRRLQLAAEKSGVPALLLRVAGHRRVDAPGATSAVTRWRVSPRPSAPSLDADGRATRDIGAPRWRIELTRNRFGDPARADIPTWTVEWNDETGDLAVVPEAVDRPLGAAGQRLVG
ncbi:MAG: damage-inducible mutagenesis protein [Rhodospirillales bacterium]|nr:MAG: damage-inducible mutagenesis protein [Rhodospirillales bacterium]